MDEMLPIPGYEGLYSATRDGRIYSHPKSAPLGSTGRVHAGVWMKPQLSRGYKAVHLCKCGRYNKFTVHRLVANTWIANPSGCPQINHINGDKSDNRVANLEWCTSKQNVAHAIATGLVKPRTAAQRTASAQNARKAKTVFMANAAARKAARAQAWLMIAMTIVLASCALAPNSIRPEIEHMSHVTQHFGHEDTNYGVNLANVVAHWDVTPRVYFELAEGINISPRNYVYGVRPGGGAWQFDQANGEIVGPREQFTARIGYIFTVKK